MARSGRHGADDKLASLLAQGHAVDYAAKAAGVSERTAFRRLADPTFKATVERLRREALERAAAVLVTASTTAVTSLTELSRSATSENVRQQASRSILELAVSLRTHVSIEERVEALEASLAARKE